MIESSLFDALEPQDQARCREIRRQIEAWLASPHDPAPAHRIWSRIVAFENHLAEVNHRDELVAYDVQMLRWALGQVQDKGMTDAVLERLADLYGLFPQLNRLLASDEDVSDETWGVQLRRALMLASLSSEKTTS